MRQSGHSYVATAGTSTPPLVLWNHVRASSALLILFHSMDNSTLGITSQPSSHRVQGSSSSRRKEAQYTRNAPTIIRYYLRWHGRPPPTPRPDKDSTLDKAFWKLLQTLQTPSTDSIARCSKHCPRTAMSINAALRLHAGAEITPLGLAACSGAEPSAFIT